jgi:hypothetical protein
VHALAFRAATFPPVLPFPVVATASATAEKSAAKGAAQAKSTAPFPELLEGLVDTADAAVPQAAKKEHGLWAFLWPGGAPSCSPPPAVENSSTQVADQATETALPAPSQVSTARTPARTLVPAAGTPVRADAPPSAATGQPAKERTAPSPASQSPSQVSAGDPAPPPVEPGEHTARKSREQKQSAAGTPEQPVHVEVSEAVNVVSVAAWAPEQPADEQASVAADVVQAAPRGHTLRKPRQQKQSAAGMPEQPARVPASAAADVAAAASGAHTQRKPREQNQCAAGAPEQPTQAQARAAAELVPVAVPASPVPFAQAASAWRKGEEPAPASLPPEAKAVSPAEAADPATAPQPSPDDSAGSQPHQLAHTSFLAVLEPWAAAPQEPAPRVPDRDRQHAAGSDTPAAPEQPATAATDQAASPTESNAHAVAALRQRPPEAEDERWRKPGDNGSPQQPADLAARFPAHPLEAAESQPPARYGPPDRVSAPQEAGPADRPQIDPGPEPARTAAAHDIRLQVGGDGAPRVELRLTERGGDVHVAVRTSDSRLAGELRADLPGLATRLEQSGFHATTWHPAGGGERQQWDNPRAGTAEDAQGQPQQHTRDGQPDARDRKQQEPESPDSPSHPKEKGKDFAWLLSSIR